MQRILVVGQDSLLKACIEHLLSNQSDFDVLSITFAGDFMFRQIINHYQPHVLILTELDNATAYSHYEKIMKAYDRIRIFRVSAENNWVWLFNKKRHPITHVDDFINLIRTSEPPAGK